MKLGNQTKKSGSPGLRHATADEKTVLRLVERKEKVCRAAAAMTELRGRAAVVRLFPDKCGNIWVQVGKLDRTAVAEE